MKNILLLGALVMFAFTASAQSDAPSCQGKAKTEKKACCSKEDQKSCKGKDADKKACCSKEEQKSCKGKDADKKACCSKEEQKSCKGKDGDKKSCCSKDSKGSDSKSKSNENSTLKGGKK